jgi:hypothetical protein
MTTSTDPRAEFGHLSVGELRDELDGVTALERKLQQELGRARPTREQVEALIASVQTKSTARLASLAVGGLRAATDANPGAPGFRDAETTALAFVLSSDGFADALREQYAARRPSEADLAPKVEEAGRLNRRAAAIKAELELRELDDLRAEEARRREAALDRLGS